jgi:hypothetical protein
VATLTPAARATSARVTGPAPCFGPSMVTLTKLVHPGVDKQTGHA